jgi:hypothetical protein
MTRNPQEKFVTLYDTAKKCLLILDYLYADLENVSTLAAEQLHETNPSNVIKFYIDALGMIDYFHRFHEIVSAMPLLRKDLPEVKKLDDMLSPVTECRNYLQHMRGDLMSSEPIMFPILGAISWIKNNRNYMLFPNQATQTYNVPGILFNTVEHTFICKYLISVGGYEIKLDTTYESLKLFWEWVNKITTIKPQKFKDYEWGKPKIIFYEIKPA